MIFDYTANKTFAAVHQDDAKYLFIRGPVGSGKSSGAIWHIVLNAMLQTPQYDSVRRSRYAVTRASYPALKSTVIKSWQNWFKSMVEIVYDMPIRGHMHFPHPDGHTRVDIELVFIALDRDEDVNKLQSLELTGAHMNETAEQPRGIYQMLKSRVDRYPDIKDGGAVKPFILCDYNSVPTDHWLYCIAEEEKPKKHSFYVQPPALLISDDPDCEIFDTDGNGYVVNPDADNIENLKPDYYLDQVLGADSDWVNVMILNNYGEVRTGRPVYGRDYIDSVHFVNKILSPISGSRLIIGVDLGLTPAAAFTQLITGNLMIFREVVEEDCSLHRFFEDILRPILFTEYPKFPYEIYVDPAATQRSPNDARSAVDILRAAGLHFEIAKSNDQTKRKEAVIHFLRKQGGLILGAGTPVIRKGFLSEFKYPKKRLAMLNVRNTNVEEFKEKWEKNIYSHIHEALQYTALECSEGRSIRKRSNSRSRICYTAGDAIAGY